MIVRHEIHIDASPGLVWDVTVDVERWPEWTPTVTAAQLLGGGVLRPGAEAKLQQPGQPEARWVVTTFERGRGFTWETRRPGLRMIATHEIVRERAGVKNILSIEAKGIMAMALRPILRKTFRRALAEENLGLKKYCEAMADDRRRRSI